MAKPVRSEAAGVFPFPRERLWGLLANTDHLNRRIGLPPVAFGEAERDREGWYREARAAGLPLSWRERAFEWVEPAGYRVRRVFRGGPLSEFVGGADLEEAAGGTRVRVLAEIRPRWVGAGALARLVGWKGCRDTLAYVGAAVSRWSPGAGGAEDAPAGPAVNLVGLAGRLDRLRGLGADGGTADRLADHVRTRTDEEVLHMRPFVLADRWGADRLATLRLFLHATKVGLLQLSWELICPNCRVVKTRTEGLRDLPENVHCDVCRIAFDADFERSVELRFSVHPEIRACRDVAYCVGGPMNTPHVRGQVALAAGQERAWRVELPAARRVLRTMGENHRAALVPARAGGASAALELTGNGWSAETLPFAAGPVVLNLANRTGEGQVVMLEDESWPDAAAPAALVTSLQDFRDLFASDVLSPGREVAVRNVAILFSDLKGSTDLYTAIGDAPAFGLVRDHLDFLTERVRAHRGAVVKTIGDAVMAVFLSGADAVRAAAAMQREFAGFNEGREGARRLVLKLGVHQGPAIVITSNDVLDYFGTTVNQAARVQAQSEGGDLVVSAAMAEDPAVRAALAETGIRSEPFAAPLKGIAGDVNLLRVRFPGTGPGR